jgi:alkylhydroperoxidase family enzyme
MSGTKPSPLQKLADSEVGNTLQTFQKSIMGPGDLDGRQKILAYLAASFVNESAYCVTHYRALALDAGYSEDDLRAVQTEQDHLLTPIDRATVRIARELTSTSTLDDVDSNLIDIFDDKAFIELVAVVSLANFDNRFYNALGIQQYEGQTSAASHHP